MTARHTRPHARLLTTLAATLAFAMLGALAPLALSSPRSEGASARIQPRAGFYEGQTAQGRRCDYGKDLRCLVTFKVRNGVAKNGTLEIRYAGCTAKFWVYDTDRVSGSGRFELDASSASIRGRFVTRRKVTGTVYGASSGCGTKTVSFTARRQ